MFSRHLLNGLRVKVYVRTETYLGGGASCVNDTVGTLAVGKRFGMNTKLYSWNVKCIVSVGPACPGGKDCVFTHKYMAFTRNFALAAQYHPKQFISGTIKGKVKEGLLLSFVCHTRTCMCIIILWMDRDHQQITLHAHIIWCHDREGSLQIRIKTGALLDTDKQHITFHIDLGCGCGSVPITE